MFTCIITYSITYLFNLCKFINSAMMKLNCSNLPNYFILLQTNLLLVHHLACINRIELTHIFYIYTYREK